MTENKKNSITNLNKVFDNQKLHCQLVNSSGKVLASTNPSMAAKSKNNINLKVSSNGIPNFHLNTKKNVNNKDDNLNMEGGKKKNKKHKGRHGGDLGLTSLIMPAGVNPFLTTLGLAALSGTSKGKRIVADVNPVRIMERSVSKSKGIKRSVSKSKGIKRSVSKSKTRKVRKGGNMMSLLFPKGLSASLSAIGLAGLAKTGHLGKQSLSKSRKTSRKRSLRKIQSGGKHMLSKKKSKGSKKKSKRSKKGGGSCWDDKKKSKGSKKKSKGGTCQWASIGGSKKKRSKTQKGGGSDWLSTQYARGPSNSGDSGPCGPNACSQKAFTSDYIIPNTKLAHYIAPQLTGSENSMCGGMSKKKTKSKPKKY